MKRGMRRLIMVSLLSIVGATRLGKVNYLHRPWRVAPAVLTSIAFYPYKIPYLVKSGTFKTLMLYCHEPYKYCPFTGDLGTHND